MKVIKPPDRRRFDDEDGIGVFLAGSIEMGAAENWQSRVEQMLSKYPGYIMNPRRDDWDSSWEQNITNEQFRDQVLWELKGLQRSNHVLMYFDPSTKSPISLLEFGLQLNRGKMIVCCPDGFWRKGNIDIVAALYGIPVYRTLEEAVAALIISWT